MIGSQGFAQCPTLTNTIQTFCDADSPTISDLQASVTSGNLVWYASAALTDTTVLSETISLIDGADYFADNDNGLCLAGRTQVTVNINGQLPTNVAVEVTLCAAASNTISQLTATGNNLEWFLTATATVGESALASTDLLTDGTTYFVQQTDAGCTSNRISTLVNIADPAAPSGDDEQFFCNDPSAPSIFRISDLSPRGPNIKWYDSATSISPLNESTPLTNNENYFASQTINRCESTMRFETIVRIEDILDPGTDTILEYCDNITGNIDLLAEIGGDSGGTWSAPASIPINNGDLGTIDRSLLSPGTFNFTYTLPEINACEEVSATVTIIVQEEPDAGENNTLEICTNESSIDLRTLLGGTPDAGGTWSPALNNANGDRGTFDPATDGSTISSTTYTYTVTATAPCLVDDTATITVTVEQAPVAGPDASLDLCATDSAIDLFTSLTGADTGGIWSPTLTSTTGVFDPAVDIAGDYTYTLAPTANCPGDSAIVTVAIIPQPIAGLNGSTIICSTSAAVNLFNILGGTPDTGGTWTPTLTSTTGVFDPAVDIAGVYTYTVAPTAPCTTSATATVTVTIQQAPNPGTNATAQYCTTDPVIDLFTLLGGTPDTGGIWTPTLTSNSGVFNPTVDTSGAYTYTIPATGACPSVQSVVTVTVSPQPFAGNDTTIELCTNDTAINLFTVLGGTPDAGGTWSPSLTSGPGLFNPAIETSGSTIFTYTVPALGTCPADTATVTVNLNVLPNAGTNATISVCGDNAVFDLFTLLGGTPNTGGTWSGPSNVVNGQQGTFDPAFNISGDYIYTSAGSGACEDISATVTVTVVNPTPTLPIDGEIFCIADNPLISDLIARVIPEMAGTIQIYATNTGITPLTVTTAIVNGDAYYISETDIATSCEGTNRLPVIIQINDPEIPQLSNVVAEFCLIDTPTIADLNAFITQGSNVVWVDAIINGNQFNETDALVSGDYYAIEEDINTCRSAASTVLSITINDNPAPTLNPNGNELCGVERPTIAELEANLTTASGLAVVWYDLAQGGNTLNTTDLLTDNATYYAATFNAVTGCESNNRLEITIDLTACDLDQYPLLLPDGFSPNGDNINDTYEFLDVEFLYEDYTIEIYNRYGNLLYQGDISTPPWDGTSNQSDALGNKIVPNGVYFYIFNFNRNNVPPRQGRLYLNR